MHSEQIWVWVSGWVPIYPLPVPYPCFEIGENPNPVKTGKTRKIRFGSDG